MSRWQQEYRGWRIWQDQSAFYAREPACRYPACTLTSSSLRRLWSGVDAVERSYAGAPAPIWYLFARTFPESGLVDLRIVDDLDLRKFAAHKLSHQIQSENTDY
ncbi:hypothetical protein [Methylobacterium sp. CM6257]